MAESFPPEQDLDGFKLKLEAKLKEDDQTKEIALMWGGYAALVVLFIAALVIYIILKTYKGTYVSDIPIVVGPCPQGAWVALPSLNACDYVMCPQFKNGKLASGFFTSLDDCEASMGQLFYPAQGQTAGVTFAYCTNKQGQTVPSNWKGQSSYTGEQAQSQCQADATAYNQTLNFGVTCDFVNGPTLCTPADGNVCIGSPGLYADPTDIRLDGCNQYAGCSGNTCIQFFTNQRTFPETITNPGLGTCATVNPCATCNNNCLVMNAANQLAPIMATASAGASMQKQNGNTISSTPNACPSNQANACDSPSDCCMQTAAALKLPFSLAPAPDASCSKGFQCVADPAATPSFCVQGGNCFVLSVEPSSETNASYFSCMPWTSTISPEENMVFSSQSACASVAEKLNAPSLGIKCDIANGPQACNTLYETSSACKGCTGCNALSSIASPPNDLMSSPSNYYGIYGHTLASFPCANRSTTSCAPGNPSCAFSLDTTKPLCNTCAIAGDTCSQTGWQCTSSDANSGVQCSLGGPSNQTIQQACQAFLGTSYNGTCGCNCLLPGQVCSAGPNGVNVLGFPCDVMYPGPSGMAPLSSVCGVGLMRSSHSWNPESKQCVKSVPSDYTLYQPPSSTNEPVCPQTAPTDWTQAPSNSQNSLFFYQDPNATQTQTIMACPYSVYNACHGDSPIAPPGPTGSNLPYCSYNNFSGNNPMSTFQAANAMCVMQLVNPFESQYASTLPVCLSVFDNGNKSSYVVTGAIDPGAPGSVTQSGKPSETLVDPNTYCGACSQSNPTDPKFMCPLAPDESTGFKTLKGSGSFVNTVGGWISYLANQSEISATGATQIASELSSTPTAATNSFVPVPNLYAGIQGSSLNPSQATTTSIGYTKPPSNQGNGILGYVSGSGTMRLVDANLQGKQSTRINMKQKRQDTYRDDETYE